MTRHTWRVFCLEEKELLGDKKLNQIGGELKNARTKRQSGESIDIDRDAKIKDIEMPQKQSKYKCSCCGKEYPSQSQNFPRSNSVLYKGNNGYITICKSCVEKYYQQLTEFYSGNEEHALERCCQLFDWYYNTDASAMTISSKYASCRATQYPAKMGMTQIAKNGTTYLDTLKERHSQKIYKESDIEQQPEDIVIPKETIRFFGYGYTGEEYQYLQEQFDDWANRYDCETKAKEELFKAIAIAQLNVLRVQKNGNSTEITNAMKTFRELLNTAGLNPSQEKDTTADKESFGMLIKKLENERPVGQPKEEWKDVDGIYKMIDTFFTGHLANMLHISNDKADDYNREMEKYTVKPPVYEEDDSGNDTSILDKYGDRPVNNE